MMISCQSLPTCNTAIIIHTSLVSGDLDSLEQEVREEDVAVAGPEVIQEHLRHLTGVLQEAEDSDKHLHQLNGGELLYTLHVVYTQIDTPLTCHTHTHRGTHHGCMYCASNYRNCFQL